jgi:formate dehydrogenase maturation protein FdhE
MQALLEANKTEILRQAKLFEVELEVLRKQPELQQAQILKIIDAQKQAMDALLNLFSISGFPRDPNDLQLIDRILSTLSATQRSAPQLPPERSRSMSELNSTIINLIAPKK